MGSNVRALPKRTPPKAKGGARARPAPRTGEPSAADVFEALRMRIAQQQLSPGAKLHETDLAAEFGVSRARIRDAFAALERRGLVERIPNRGAVVMRLDLSQVFHLYDIREVLEGLAARLATQNAEPARWQEHLERFRGPLKALIDAGEFDHYLGYYETLRRGIIEAAANPLLAEMLDTIYERTQALIRRTIIVPGRAEVGRQQHVQMLEAMCRGDPAEAERLRRANLRSVKAALEKYQRFLL